MLQFIGMNEDGKPVDKGRTRGLRAQRELNSVIFKMDAEKLSGKYKSATHYMLAALLPYTEANLKFTFCPSHYSSDLAKLEYNKHKQNFSADTLRAAYYRAVKQGLITIDDGYPRLTFKGRRRLNSYQPKIIKGDARLLITFDVPEHERFKRSKLRTVLREFKFKMIQKSVWETRYDCREYIETAITEYGLKNYVILFEAARVKR